MNKDKQKYRKICRQHKKALKNIAKEAEPYDFATGLSSLVEHLYFMRDYYKLNYNVWGMEKKEEDPEKYKDYPTRLEMIEQILAEYELWQTCFEKYYETQDTKIENHEVIFSKDEVDFEAFNKEYESHRIKFFELLGKYIEELWD